MPTLSPLRKKQNGQWSVSITFYSADQSPKRKVQTLSHTKKVTLLQMAERAIELYNNGMVDPWKQKIKIRGINRQTKRSLSLSDIVEEYIAHKSTYDWGDHARRSYPTVLRMFVRELGSTTTLPEVTGEDFEALIHTSPSGETCKKYYSIFNTFNSWLVEKKYVTEPFDVKLQKRPNFTKQKYITPDELEAIQKAVIRHNKKNKARGYWRPNHNTLYLVRIMRFLFISGLRIGEAINLRVGDINTDTGVFYIKGKSGETEILPYRQVPALNRIINAQLRSLNYSHPSVRLFGIKNTPRLGRNIKKFIRQALPPARAEEVSAHSLRHGAATYLLNQGLPLKVVKEWLRHRNIKTTENYAKLIQSELGQKIGSVHK